MIETHGGFSMLTQSVLVFGGDDALTFSTLPLRSERHMKSVEFHDGF